MNRILTGVLFMLLVMGSAGAADKLTIKVKAGDNQGLIDAVIEANKGENEVIVEIETGPNGETGFVFTEAYNGTNNALPVLTGHLEIQNFLSGDARLDVGFAGTGNRDFRLIELQGSAWLDCSNIDVHDFGINGAGGGAILATGSSHLLVNFSHFRDNFSSGNGGAIRTTQDAGFLTVDCRYEGNRASNLGGAISIEGAGIAQIGTKWSDPNQEFNVFKNNQADVFGCEINVNTSGRVDIIGNVFDGQNCQNVLFENPFGKINMRGNTLSHGENAVDSTDLVRLFGNIFSGSMPPSQLNSSGGGSPKPQAACNDFGTNAFVSEGYNISTEDSCSLDQPSDQPNTNPMISFDENGLPVVDAGSPVIDAGSAEVYLPEPDGLPVLPCGLVDIHGVARPQDGNGDGVFECDPGVTEFVGAGMVEAGHSGAFFNALRNGEGNYVEILTDEIAVVYTFTFRPDGSGPAWFIGVGDIRDNGIVINDLLRPVGTSFGAGFNAADIIYSQVGGMSMVFPDCEAGGDGGNVAYSGNPEAGYEGLLSRAQRITSITGCNTTPTANAGLSGSFYDPARNGEGLIIQWLDNGDVIAIFFTYDQNGDQFWVFGVGTPTGKSVTINALYPASSSAWGQSFSPDDVNLQNWGTFNLTWTACDSLDFDYSSTVSGYGSGSYVYTRVSTMQGTSCPAF